MAVNELNTWKEDSRINERKREAEGKESGGVVSVEDVSVGRHFVRNTSSSRLMSLPV
jgi:hypothetical protein